MTRSRVLALAVLPLCMLVASCGDDIVAPTPTPIVTTAPQVSRIQATTPPAMNSVGDTVKLSLTAFYTNGTSRDVAAEAVWTVNMPSVVRVTNGEATALSLGATYIWARFDRFNSASVKIQVTPPGTFAIVGGTREPGMSGEPGVTVTHPASGLTTVSDAEGSFTLGGLTDRTVVLQKAGFEDATYTVVPEDFQWLAVQRQIRVQTGDTVSVRIAPHDMDYAPPISGERCSPCKLIRLSNTPGTRVRVTLKWTPVSIGLKFWNDDGMFDQTSAGLLEREIFSDLTELWMYVGQNPKGATLTYVDVQVSVTKIG